RTGAQANQQLYCEVVAVVNSLDNYWTYTFARSGQRYTPPRTVFFTGGVNTGCGGAPSDTGPFDGPADSRVYIDLSFYKELE
ncbi:neutral zinc metallopeptidase, partial [Salmonella sp. SAL4434]|uniref:neutral zinc metallopeptidase n=1 Tax=Salmonella sp. SAL4434 TaxID=3159889 RepID=UPI003979F974